MPRQLDTAFILKAIKDNKGKSAKHIAEAVGLTTYAVAVTARRQGIVLPKTKRTNFQRKPREMLQLNGVSVSRIRYDRIIAFKAMLPQLDQKERLNADDMASRMGVTSSTIRYWLQILNHRPLNHNGRTIFRHDKSGWPAIVDPMLKARKPLADIVKAIPWVCASSVYRWLANTGRIEVHERDRSSYKSHPTA